MQDMNDRDLRDRAVRAARGQEPFDLLLTGGTIVDCATLELRAADVGIVGPMIASVHAPGQRADAAQVRDVSGMFLSPGLIDAHMHVESSMMTPRTYAQVVVPQGTTTAVWDPHELGNVAGLDGVRWAIEASRGLPLRFVILAPSCVPSAPGLERAGAEFNGPEMAEMLSWPEIAGVAEMMDMRGVLKRGERATEIVGAGLAAGKLVCGHGRELAGADLQAFAAAGIASDHEITSGDDLIAKLKAGFWLELRGSHDHLLPACVEALNRLPVIPQTLTLCTDDVFPDDLVERGGMNDHIRRLVAYGLDPLQALRCATLNEAMRLGRGDLGLIAPGRRADIVAFADLKAFVARLVLASGQVVAEAGRLMGLIANRDPAGLRDTMRLHGMEADAFKVRSTVQVGRARLHAIRGARFTKWSEQTVAVAHGVVQLPPDVSVMAVIHRHGRAAAEPKLALLQDWGEWRGALATTVAHDSHNLNLFGRDPADFALAANTVIEMGGGMAVASKGQVLARLPLPIAGLVSDAPPEEVARAFADLRASTDQIVDWLPPLRIFKATVGASLACNAGPHLTDIGLTDGATGRIVLEPTIAAA